MTMMKDDRLASEKVEAIDHVLELILNYMDSPTVQSARLVSHRWKYFGAKVLQHRVTIKLALDEISTPMETFPETFQAFKFQSPSKRFASLLVLMENAEIFPCLSFNIRSQIESPSFQSITLSFAHQIKKLTLHLPYEHDLEMSNIKFQNILSNVTKTLSESFFNLDSLDLSLKLPSHFEWSDNELKNSNVLNVQSLAGTNLPNLKTLVTRGKFPRVLFEDIVTNARNLSEYYGYGNVDNVLQYFLEEGENRIHILKHLEFYSPETTTAIVRQLMDLHGAKMQLKSIRFFYFEHLNQEDRFWREEMPVIDRVLELCSNSLRELTLHP